MVNIIPKIIQTRTLTPSHLSPSPSPNPNQVTGPVDIRRVERLAHRYLRVGCPVLEYPVEQLFFSGEATSPDGNGFLHGAYYAGQRTADKVLACMDLSSASNCPAQTYDQAKVIAKYHETPSSLAQGSGVGGARRSLQAGVNVGGGQPRHHSKKFRAQYNKEVDSDDTLAAMGAAATGVAATGA